jgi:Family of unknown function (DUF6220)
MALAILLASTLTHPVSSADSLSARSVLHRRDGRNADPGWWTYHSAWVAIFQWLVVPLPILAWLSGAGRGRRTLFATIPLLQVALQYVLAHRAIEGRLTIGLGLHALDAGLLLLIAAGLAVGLFD